MSLTKRSDAYARHMDEVMSEEVDNDAQLYAEWRYLEELKKQTNKPKPNDNVDQRTKRQERI